MFAMAARRMGYRVHVFSPESDTPTGQVADAEITADYEDLEAVERFARGVQVVTFEFENVPLAATQAASKHVPVRPDGSVLHTTQNRLREKSFLAGRGFPVTPFRAVRTRADAEAALRDLGLPAVLKTAGFGYDGKGQTKITSSEQMDAVLAQADNQEMILEAMVEFDREVSVIGARGLDGAFAHWGLIENTHRNQILDVSTAPADVPPEVAREAVRIAHSVLEELDVVGILCVEFFLTQDARLLINELAPRTHNSGHLTLDASITSQFEQQLRAVCGLPLGSTEAVRPAAMANLLGDLWEGGEPNWAAIFEIPDVKLHLYGKKEARLGRKMGHLTALARTALVARSRVCQARDILRRIRDNRGNPVRV
jgi:5-(carboxyamino)imidazole ribonucleotide synthase